MDVTYLLAIFVLFCLLIHMVKHISQRRRFPGGPWGFPIVGYLPMLGPNPHITFTRLRKQYGDVYSVRMGQWLAVVVNGYDNLRHILVEKSDITASRPPFYSFQFSTADRGPGLGFSEYGARYITMRKCTMGCIKQVLRREVGDVYKLVTSEAKKLAKGLLDHKSEPSNIGPLVSFHIGSFVYETGYGRQGKSNENDDFVQYRKLYGEFLVFQGTDNIVNLLPWTRFFLKKKLQMFHHIMSLWHSIDSKAQKYHFDTFDAHNLRDATDLFIKKSRGMTKEFKANAGVTDSDIVNCVEELVGAGCDTLPAFCHWGLLFLALNPEVQERFSKEVIDIFGTDCDTRYELLSEMPYTEATLVEIARLSSILPLALPHLSTESVEIGEYVIPANTLIITNIYSANMDERMWSEPEKFRPGRFLDRCNAFNRSLAAKVVVFGMGRRSCPGEAYARCVSFLVLTTLVQRCRFLTVPGERYDLEGVFGMSISPKPHKLIVLPRNNNNCA